MAPPVLLEVDNQIAVITLNRPERRNAINRHLLVDLYGMLETVAANNEIRVVIITGNGPSFCAGLDLDAIGKENLFDPRGDGKELPDLMRACDKPIIAAVNGHAITGGFELALNCDFIIAAENAQFSDTHARVGYSSGVGHDPASPADRGPAAGQANLFYLPADLCPHGAGLGPGQRSTAP